MVVEAGLADEDLLKGFPCTIPGRNAKKLKDRHASTRNLETHQNSAVERDLIFLLACFVKVINFLLFF